MYGSFTILVHLCEVDGKLPFSSASTVLVTEVLKVNEFFLLLLLQDENLPVSMANLHCTVIHS